MNRRVLLLFVGSLSMGLTPASGPSLAAQVPPPLRAFSKTQEVQ